MKTDKKEIIHIAIFVIFLCVVGFIVGKFIGGLQDNQNEYLCVSLELSILTNSFDDIDRMEESKQLCNNENCTAYFNKKINNNLIIINDTIEGKYCERLGLVVESRK